MRFRSGRRILGAVMTVGVVAVAGCGGGSSDAPDDFTANLHTNCREIKDHFNKSGDYADRADTKTSPFNYENAASELEAAANLVDYRTTTAAESDAVAAMRRQVLGLRSLIDRDSTVVFTEADANANLAAYTSLKKDLTC